MFRNIFIGIIFSVVAPWSFACLEFTEPELVSTPEPRWFGFAPTTNKAEVIANIVVSDSGGVISVDIVSIKPEGLPEEPLKMAIKMSHFFPARVKVSSDKYWSAVQHSMQYRFSIAW